MCGFEVADYVTEIDPIQMPFNLERCHAAAPLPIRFQRNIGIAVSSTFRLLNFKKKSSDKNSRDANGCCSATGQGQSRDSSVGRLRRLAAIRDAYPTPSETSGLSSCVSFMPRLLMTSTSSTSRKGCGITGLFLSSPLAINPVFLSAAEIPSPQLR